jgi:hypothetical protein
MLHLEDQKKLLRARRSRLSSAPLLTSSSGNISADTIQRARSQQLLPSDIPSLQRTIGNQNVQRLLSNESSGSMPDIQRDTSEEEETQVNNEDVDNTIDDSDTSISTSWSGGFGGKKKTLGRRLRRYGRIAKKLAINSTVRSYGKNGIHAIIGRDERKVNKAERLITSNPDAAKALLNDVTPATRQGLKHIPASTARTIATSSPIWYMRWRIVHSRWKALARQVGLDTEPINYAERFEKSLESTLPQESAPEPEPEPEQPEWHRGRAQYKDVYGHLNAYMLGVSSSTFKSRDMSEREKRRVWQKWRLNEMDDTSLMFGKQRLGWLPSYVRSKKADDKPKFYAGKYRPVWGFDKPRGPQKTGTGLHRLPPASMTPLPDVPQSMPSQQNISGTGLHRLPSAPMPPLPPLPSSELSEEVEDPVFHLDLPEEIVDEQEL